MYVKTLAFLAEIAYAFRAFRSRPNSGWKYPYSSAEISIWGVPWRTLAFALQPQKGHRIFTVPEEEKPGQHWCVIAQELACERDPVKSHALFEELTHAIHFMIYVASEDDPETSRKPM